MPMPRLRPVALSIALLAFAAQASADSERLEADLRALFAESEGELTIGKLSDSLFGGSSTAEDVVYLQPSGEALRIDRYVVEGDYDSPKQVVIDGLTVGAQDAETSVLSATKLTINEPAKAVIDVERLAEGELLYAADSLVAEKLAFVANEQSAGVGTEFHELLADFVGRIKLDRLELRQLTENSVDGVSLTGLSGEFEKLQDLGAGRFSLESLVMNGISMPNPEGGGEDYADELDSIPSVKEMELTGLEIDSDALVASIEGIVSDQDWNDGQTSITVNNMVIDLGRMIELMPAEERTQARMFANMLTGGTNVVTLNAEGSGKLDEKGDGKADYLTQGTLELDDAFSLDATLGALLLTPQGIEAADYVTQIEQGNLELLDFESGKARLGIVDRGLFGRIPSVAATSQGISEAEFLAQARTQAKGIGNMFGPQVAAVLTGLVNMMDGKASQMAVFVTLPSYTELQASTNDPLGLPGKLSMEVTTE